MSTDENTDMDTPGDPRDPLAAWILDARTDVERLTERTSEDDVHLGDQIRGSMRRISLRSHTASLLMESVGFGCSLLLLFALHTWATGNTIAPLFADAALLSKLLRSPYYAMTIGFGLLLLPGAVLLRSPILSRQLLGIASAWVMLGLVLVSYPVASIGNGMDTSFLSMLGVPVVLALLLRGTPTASAIARDRHFQPSAFRGVLTLSLVMAIADALVLGSFAMASGGEELLRLFSGDTRFVAYRLKNLLMEICVPAAASWTMFKCARGLLRLKSWALFATITMNWLVMYGCLYEIIDVGFGALLLAFTSVIQLFLPVPMLGAVIRGKVIPRPLLERLSRRVLRVALLAALAGMALDAWRGWL